MTREKEVSQLSGGARGRRREQRTSFAACEKWRAYCPRVALAKLSLLKKERMRRHSGRMWLDDVYIGARVVVVSREEEEKEEE